MSKIFILLSVLFCLASCAPASDDNFDEVLMSGNYLAKGGYLKNECASCMFFSTTGDKIESLNIYLFPKKESWELLKKFNGSAEASKRYETYVKQLSSADLKKQFHIYIYLIRGHFPKDEQQSISEVSRKDGYREERHTFDEQKNKWVLSDMVTVTDFSETYKVIKWREAFLGAELNRVRQMIKAHEMAISDEPNTLPEGLEEYSVPEGFYTLDSASIDLKTRQYKLLVLEKNSEKDNKAGWHFELPLVLLEKKNGHYFKVNGNNELIFKRDDQCPADGYGRLVVKGAFFTIEQVSCADFLFVHAYLTFRIDEQSGNVVLHKYGETYTDRSDPDRLIPDRTWTAEDFGTLTFAELRADRIIALH